MDTIDCIETKKNLIASEDIFTLLANLYVFCKKNTTEIINLTKNNPDYRKLFNGYLRKFQGKILEFLKDSEDIFKVNISRHYETITAINDLDEKDFLLSIWTYFLAIDS